MQRQGLYFLMSIFLLLAALFLSASHSNNRSDFSNLAPDPMNGHQISIEDSPTNVDWATARQLIMEGKVKQVSQTHGLQVSLELKTGERWQTVEPSIDAVFKVINKCGKPCKNMILATE